MKSYQYDAAVLGASGFIGRHLLDRLLKNGSNVRILSRSRSAFRSSLGNSVDVVYGRLESLDSVMAVTKNVKTIYNCAGLSSDWGKLASFENANVIGVANLIEAMKVNTPGRLIHLSTSDVYGYKEVAGDENCELSDVGLHYNSTKVLGEKLIWKSVNQQNLPITVLRPSTVFGPGAKDWVVEICKALLNKNMLLLNKGESHAGLIYVDNLVNLMIKTAELEHASGECYNIRDSYDVSWQQYVMSLASCLAGRKWKCFEVPSSIVYGGAIVMETAYKLLNTDTRPFLTRHAAYLMSKDQGFDITKAQNELKFESAVSFEQAMLATCKWINRNDEISRISSH